VGRAFAGCASARTASRARTVANAAVKLLALGLDLSHNTREISL